MKRLIAVLFALGLLRGCSYAPVGGMVDVGGIADIEENISEPEIFYPVDNAEYFSETSVFDFEIEDFDHELDSVMHIRVTLPFGIKYYASGNSLNYVNTPEQREKSRYYYADVNWHPDIVYEAMPEFFDRVTELQQEHFLIDTVTNEKTIDGMDVTVFVSKMYEKDQLHDVLIEGIYPLESGCLMFWYNLIDCRDVDGQTVDVQISDAVNSLKSLVYSVE